MANTARRISHSQLTAVKAPRAPREPKDLSNLGVVDQVRIALKSRNRLATLLGAILGGVAPLISYVVAHYELNTDSPLYTQPGTLLVLGCLLFSASTVYAWGKLAFKSGPKALGYVVLTEGALIIARTHWLGLVALALLIGINSVATGCTLALNRK
jgi:hypothetical protein